MRDAAACWFPFERYVNSKDNQTGYLLIRKAPLFERYVNSKDNQTNLATNKPPTVFERYVNSKDNQTSCCVSFDNARLRDM